MVILSFLHLGLIEAGDYNWRIIFRKNTKWSVAFIIFHLISVIKIMLCWFYSDSHHFIRCTLKVYLTLKYSFLVLSVNDSYISPFSVFFTKKIFSFIFLQFLFNWFASIAKGNIQLWVKVKQIIMGKLLDPILL